MPSASVQSSGSGSGRGRGHQYFGSAGQTPEEPAVQTDGLLCARRDSGGETGEDAPTGQNNKRTEDGKTVIH